MRNYHCPKCFASGNLITMKKVEHHPTKQMIRGWCDSCKKYWRIQYYEIKES